MKEERTQVVVIGGGATGTGCLRDLSLRGIDAVLVEKNDLATGTSGRFHGLLHSGARYVAKDIGSAKECIEENRILKKIAPHCIEDTGGLFVATKRDDPSYEKIWLDGCARAGIPVKPLDPRRLMQDEPALARDVALCYQVPDAAIDGFSLAAANVRSALELGGKAYTYTVVTGLEMAGEKVRGVKIYDRHAREERIIHADYVINATGAWAGTIAVMTGNAIRVRPDKGVLLIFNHRITDAVLNHLRPPGDGDIFVPHGSVTVFGTSSTPAASADDNAATTKEVLAVLKEGNRLVPDLASYRIIRAFAGVRPLYEARGSAGGRQATREFTLIDHEKESGIGGIVSVVGGKFTTFRLMARDTVDCVVKRLKIDAPCRTDRVPLIPSPVVREMGARRYLCQCERVTETMLDQAVEGKSRFSLGDVRRLTRLGMGPCQGTFCTFRATGYYHRTKGLSARDANCLLMQNLQERWKGSLPILWGEQAQEIELTRGIYLGLLNMERIKN